MNGDALASFAQDALTLALRLSLPALGACLLAGLVVGFLQAATQNQDSGLGFVPKLAAVSGALLLSRALLGDGLVAFYSQVLSQIASIGR